MNWIEAFFSNRILISGLAGWLSAQVIKLILYCVVNRKFDFTRLFGDGGMPSGHSATVTAVTVACGRQYGAASFEFAIAFILAAVVMHDAMGIRQESGKHAKAINELIELLQPNYPMLPEEKLKEFLGHTPLQVLGGMIVGIAASLILA